VYADGSCDLVHLLDYLGGASGADVLRRDLDLRTVTASDGGVACTVGWLNTTLSGPAKGVLPSPAGGAWRRCLDARSQAALCTGPHTAEVTYDRSEDGNGTAPLDCPSRATAYLGRPFGQVSDRLRVDDDGRQCALSVRGNNVLTASLRDLRSNALPIEAAPN
jgi:hypothetical protein